MKQERSGVLVIGGGVAGLAAAGELARHGREVVLLEARERLGGRVFTQRPPRWNAPVELGAEFIHAGNAALWRLLKKHRIKTRRVPGAHWRFDGQAIRRIEDVAGEIEAVTKQIDPRRMRGWSFAEFLQRKGRRFSAAERDITAGFVEGFEAAPTQVVSAVAMEGESLDTSEQFAMPGGYQRFIDALAGELPHDRVTVRLGCPVRSIRWRRGAVEVQARGGKFTGAAAVVTLPLGVLQARRGQRGAVRFEPALRARQKLLSRMHMGHVIRLTLRFTAHAWRALLPEILRRSRGGFGFIHSRVEGVPVWWALSSEPILTGWAGGPDARELANRSKCGIFEKALSSLAEVFGVPKTRLGGAVIDYATHNWSRDPFSRGAYSFIAAGQDDASEKLRQPIADTLFFAGEATADGAETGTVHGALASGMRAAKEVRIALGRNVSD